MEPRKGVESEVSPKPELEPDAESLPAPASASTSCAEGRRYEFRRYAGGRRAGLRSARGGRPPNLYGCPTSCTAEVYGTGLNSKIGNKLIF